MTLEDELYNPIVTDRLPQRRRNKKPEAKIQKAIAVWLISRGVVLAVTDAGILNRMGLGMGCGIPAGWPDLTCLIPGGRFLGVECKAPGGRQRDDQVQMQRKIQDAGGWYILADSLADFVDQYLNL
jgi:hypothetical protein